MRSNLTTNQQVMLEMIATTDLVDEIIERFKYSNDNEFLTKPHVQELLKVLNDPTTATV